MVRDRTTFWNKIVLLHFGEQCMNLAVVWMCCRMEFELWVIVETSG